MLLVAEINIDTHSPTGLIHHERSRILLDQCNSLSSSSCDISHSTGSEILRQHPLLRTIIFHLQSKSLLYCAVPKVATKTLLTALIYMHLLDIREQLNSNSTNSRVESEQSINHPKLIQELRKQGITIPEINQSISLASSVETYLNLFRSDSMNIGSTPRYPNPWRLDLRKAFPRTQLSILTNLSQIFSPSVTRILFVRHPFDRLASAYKERIALLEKDRVEPEPDYDQIRKLICIASKRINVSRSSILEGNWCENAIPSFEDFVRFILFSAKLPTVRARLDHHWQPYSSLCQVCKFKYNFIGKHETFNDDFAQLIRHFNLSGWNIHERKGASGCTRSDYQMMFTSLSDEIICQLQDLYADDLHLFNYRVDDYVQRPNLICQTSKTP